MRFSATGIIHRMQVQHLNPVQYQLTLGNDIVYMNERIGQPLEIQFLQEIYCVACGVRTSKAYGQGFCFNCFQNAPENSECIIHPERCCGHLGIGRDAAWEFEHHVAPHFVYLAWSGGLKVGVTRHSQIPTRWIDQGATHAILLARTPYRRLAGQIENVLKQHYSDKTNWRHMLQNQVSTTLQLKDEKQKAFQLLSPHLQMYVLPETEITQIHFPVLQYPEKVNSISLDKQPEIKSTLMGIKGQYLIFNDGHVINLRSFSGYKIRLSY